VTGSGSERVLIREGKYKDEGAFPVLLRFRYREIWTNPATGEWFVVRGRLTFNEVGATRVEGSIFEFRTVEAASRSSSRTPRASRVHEPVARSREGYAGEDHERETPDVDVRPQLARHGAR
jgi:hypothetical protein